MRPIHIATILIIGVSIFFGIALMKKKEAQDSAAVVQQAAAAPVVYMSAEVQPVNAIQAGDGFVGMTVPDPGWQVHVDKITQERDGKALRISVTTPNPLWGQMWIVAVVPEETDIQEKEWCTIVGRVDSVDKFKDGGPVEATRLVLRDAKVLKNISRPG